MTKAEKLIEIAKCMKNPIYGIETYLETEDRTQGGFVPFKLFPRQVELVKGYMNHQHNIVMKPRQAGISTTTAAYAAILTALASKKSPEKILIAANKQETAKEFLKKIRDFTSQLPDWMDVNRPPGSEGWYDKEKNSSSHYKLWNGSEVKAVASSKDALRGYAPSLIIIDEAAFIEGSRGEEFYEAAQPSLSTGGHSILISCVTEDTFVYTNNGIKEVSNFIDKTKKGGYLVDEYSVLGYGKQRKSSIMFNNGLHDTKIINTKFSRLEGSLNHKIYSYSEKENSFGWHKLEDLSVGDYVPIIYNNNIWGSNDDCSDFKPIKNNKNKNTFKPKKINEDIAYFMGLFLAEGSSYKFIKNNKHVGTSITISCGDDVSETFNKLNLNFSYDGKWHYTTGSKELGEFLEYVGFDLSLKASEKVIPERIFSLSKKNVITFIRGFMDGDGYSRRDNGRIGLCSSSKRLIEQFRILFMNLGILCEYQEILQKPSKIVSVESMNYRLQMNTKFSKIYYDLIGFGFDRKQNKKEFLVTNRDNDPRDVIPCGAEIIKESYVKQKKGLKYFKDKGCDISHITKKNSKVNHVSRGLMLSYLDIINEKYNNIDENIHWVKIKSIEDSKNYTYDFSLPNVEDDLWCHSIIYNGILGHQTPNGYDPLYHKTYKTAKDGNNNFNIVEMKWYEDPRYNKKLKWIKTELVDGEEKIEELIENDKSKWDDLIKEGWEATSPWFENMCAQLNHNKRSIAQELLCSFLGSGDQVIDDKYKKRQEKENVKDPIRKEWIDGNMWIWEDPIKGHRYIMGVDAASGSSDDFGTVWILDYDTGNQVAEYRGKVKPDVLGEIAKHYGESYNAFCVVDLTGGYGISTVLKMLELGYPNKNMYYDTPFGIDALEKNKQLEKHMKNGKLPGLNFQAKRGTIVSGLEEAIRLGTVKIRSVRTINEMDTFVFINGRADHMKGYHDDCLKEGTLIKTIDGYKDIESIKPGELVLTHLGNYKPVEKILRKPFNGDWYDFNFSGQMLLGLSYNHPLYVAKYTNSRYSEDKKNERDWLIPNEWVDLKNNYSTNNYLPRQISILEKLKPNECKIIKYDDVFEKNKYENVKLNEIKLDDGFAKFLGLFLADGHSYIENNRNGNRYGIVFSFHENDITLIDEIKSYIENFGISVKLKKDKTKSYTLSFNNKLFWGLMDMCYDDNREKMLPYYHKYLGLDLSHTLEYWIKGDGWIDKRGDYDFISCTTSKKLILGMRDISWSLGYYSQIRKNSRHRYGKKTKDQYWLHIRKDFRKQDNIKKISDFEYGTKTVNINKTNFNGFVYNLQVKDDESFVANGIVVHNCLMGLAMCNFVANTSFKDLEKSKGQAKAMIDSWAITTTSTDNVNELNTTSVAGFYTDNNNKQILEQTKEYNWLFSGFGQKRRR